MRDGLPMHELAMLAGLALLGAAWFYLQRSQADSYAGPEYVDPQDTADQAALQEVWPVGVPIDSTSTDSADLEDPAADPNAAPPVDTSASAGSVIMQALSSPVRGIRNNNPGNLEKGPAWVGLSPEQADSRFAQFTEMRYGIRAMTVLMRNFQKPPPKWYGLKSIRQIITRWAPAIENNTPGYIASVAKSLGVGPDDTIDTNDPAVAAAMVRAIANVECGPAAMLISDATIAEGVSLA